MKIMSNICVACGIPIPEGSQVCNECLKAVGIDPKENEKKIIIDLADYIKSTK